MTAELNDQEQLVYQGLIDHAKSHIRSYPATCNCGAIWSLEHEAKAVYEIAAKAAMEQASFAFKWGAQIWYEEPDSHTRTLLGSAYSEGERITREWAEDPSRMENPARRGREM